jgi:death-on-curing protein
VIVYLSLEQVLGQHRMQIQRFGGSPGLRDRGGLESALARPQMTFGGEDLYPDLHAKAAALMHSLVANHPFVDGNKRVGSLAALQFLLANGWETVCSAQELVEITLRLAEGSLEAEALAIWLRQHSRERGSAR